VIDEEKRKKLMEIIDQLDKTNKSSNKWKQIISENRDKFEEIKKSIKLKQLELKNLVVQKQIGEISQEKFNIEIKALQNELTNLEFEIYKLRLKHHWYVKDE